MSEKPSYLHSTFSILTIIAVLGFVSLCLYNRDVTNLKELVLMLVGGYGVKKGMEMGPSKSEEKK